MEDSTPVALITGGASGMGHAVAEALSRSSWRIAIVDLNADQSEQAFGPSALFIRADVTSYDDQLRAFETIKKTFGRIDFVFANAGVIGKADFYLEPEAWPPKAPSLAAEDICLKGVIYTSYLAMHFMRRNAQPGGVIVMTASAASLYATPDLPLYTSAKHGVLGLMRSLSSKLVREGIRVNCILPGAIRTALLSAETWSQFTQDHFTSVEEVVSATLELLNDPTANGRAMEISKGEVFDRRQPDFCNEAMRQIMTDTSYL